MNALLATYELVSCFPPYGCFCMFMLMSLDFEGETRTRTEKGKEAHGRESLLSTLSVKWKWRVKRLSLLLLESPRKREITVVA